MTTLLPNISEYNQRRLNKSLRCLTGCMAKANKHQFENPEIYPYNLTLDVNVLSYKIEKNDGFVISDGKMKITNETRVKLLYNVHGATFLFFEMASRKHHQCCTNTIDVYDSFGRNMRIYASHCGWIDCLESKT
jgi:hypothetical protein